MSSRSRGSSWKTNAVRPSLAKITQYPSMLFLSLSTLKQLCQQSQSHTRAFTITYILTSTKKRSSCGLKNSVKNQRCLKYSFLDCMNILHDGEVVCLKPAWVSLFPRCCNELSNLRHKWLCNILHCTSQALIVFINFSLQFISFFYTGQSLRLWAIE